MDQSSLISRRILAALAGLVVFYCLCMLAAIATVPDLRLRFLLVDSPPRIFSIQSLADPPGIEIRRTAGTKWRGDPIQPGDRLLALGDAPLDNYLDFAQEMSGIPRRDHSGRKSRVRLGQRSAALGIARADSGKRFRATLDTGSILAAGHRTHVEHCLRCRRFRFLKRR